MSGKNPAAGDADMPIYGPMRRYAHLWPNGHVFHGIPHGK